MNSRRKGHDFERAMAEQLRPIWPGARRGLSQARAGAEVPDVEGTPFWIECKTGRSVSVTAALRQAQLASVKDQRPVVVIARDYAEQPVVVMSLHAWLELHR